MLTGSLWWSFCYTYKYQIITLNDLNIALYINYSLILKVYLYILKKEKEETPESSLSMYTKKSHEHTVT